jgi:hypothetical protein
VNGAVAVSLGPLERGKQAAVLGHVVRGDTDGSLEFFDQRSIRTLDPNSVSGGTRITTGAAVDVGDYGI